MKPIGPVSHIWQGVQTFRVTHENLRDVNPKGRPCEACGGRMADHEWADVTESGIVVACSNEEN